MIIRRLSGLTMFVGFVWLLGSVGSADIGVGDVKTLLIRTLIGLGLFLVGFVGLKVSGSDVVS